MCRHRKHNANWNIWIYYSTFSSWILQSLASIYMTVLNGDLMWHEGKLRAVTELLYFVIINLCINTLAIKHAYFWEPFLHLTSINIYTIKHFHLWRRAERATQSRIQRLNRSVTLLWWLQCEKGWIQTLSTPAVSRVVSAIWCSIWDWRILKAALLALFLIDLESLQFLSDQDYILMFCVCVKDLGKP